MRRGLTVAALVAASMPLLGAPAKAANPSADLDQCENGKASAPHACDWVDGSLNENNSHYGEGHSVPYRIVFSNLAAGSHTTTIQWDTTKSGKHALDYLTSYNRTEGTANPCAGVSGCTLASATTAPIPDDPNVGPQVAGSFSMWNGTVTATSAYTLTGSYAGDSSTSITITFTTASSSPVVLAFGGHIATRLDWGPNSSASGISGAPYHMRLLDLDGRGGNQDRSLSAEAVVFPSSITIVKQATPEGARSFAFAASDGLGNFSLVDDGSAANAKTFSGLTDFYTNTSKATYDFTETVPGGWVLSSIACSAGSTVVADTATASLSVRLAEGTDVVCTFNNTDVVPTITVTKTPSTTAVTEPGEDVTFEVEVENSSAAESLTLTELSDSVYGDVTDLATTTCALPQAIAASASYSCSFTAPVTGDAGDVHTNHLDATVEDTEDNEITGRGSATVDIEDRLPAVSVTKTPSVSSVVETGAEVTFTVEVSNETAEPVTVTELDDTVYGDITALDSTDCAVPQEIPGDDKHSCSFTVVVAGDAPTAHENTVEASAEDNEGNETSATGTATVAVTDRLPALTVTKAPNRDSVPEPGGDVSFTVEVTNGTAEPVTLYELTDSDFGNLGSSALVSASNCALPAAVAGGDFYTCIFTAFVAGDAGFTHGNTVTARVRDDEGNQASNTGDAEVDVTDVAPAVSVTKTPRRTSVPEPGADVTFDVVVTNQSVEPVTLYELTDSVFGDVTTLPGTTCADDVALTKPGTYSCSFVGFVEGGGATTHTNVVTARVRDNEGGTASNTGSASVGVTDVAPRVALAKQADATRVTRGTVVTYTYTVTNPGPEPLVAVAVTDDKCAVVTFVGGDAGGDGVLEDTETWTYTCAQALSGTTVNTATVVAEDDEGTSTTDTATATVTVRDPKVAIDKTATPSSATPGQTVVYSYVVTNPGDEPLTDVVVTDDKCSPVTFVGGDVGDDDVLGTGETWTYTCSVVVGTDVGELTNIGTVTAKDPRGATVSADDTETITVVLGVTIERPRTVAGVELPRTGRALLLWVTTGGALLTFGFLFVTIGRRRRRAS